MKKIIALVVTLSLVGAFALSATMAYLTGQSEKVVNAFTVGDINITLAEPNVWKPNSKIIPGEPIPKDPTVTVTQGSEPCYVFVYLKNTLAVAKAGGGWDYVTPNINATTTDWELVPGTTKVDANGVKEELYQYIGSQAASNVVDAAAAAKILPFFTTVTVPGASFTKESMTTLANKGLNMTVQAYAHQSANVDQETAVTAAKTAFSFPVTTP